MNYDTCPDNSCPGTSTCKGDFEKLEEAPDQVLISIVLNSEGDYQRREIKEYCLSLLYTRHYSHLMRKGHQVGLSCEEADICANSVLFSLMRTEQLKKLDWTNPQSFEFRLVASMRNKCIDVLRSHNAYAAQSTTSYDDLDMFGEPIRESIVSDGGNPEHLLIEADSLAEIHEKLRAYLTGKEYRVFILLSDNASISEIAEEMDITNEQVSRLIYKGKQKVKVWAALYCSKMAPKSE